MKLDCAPGYKKIGKLVNRMVERNGRASEVLGDATLQIGLASDAHYGVPLSAVQSPIYVGDGAVTGRPVGITPELEALYKKSRFLHITAGSYSEDPVRSPLQ